MKAIVQATYGPPDVLELHDIDRPGPNEDEVLVRVHAASLNPIDWHFIRGSPFPMRLLGAGLRRPKRRTPGVDVAGTVKAVGPGATRLRPGDEVFGWCRGGCAQYVATREQLLVPKPGHLTFEQAAAIPLAGTTALQGLRDTGRLRAGHKVLIIGASGGVGTFAVQIARLFGAEVTGVCSTGNVEMVRSLGADHVIDYTRQDFTRTGQRYDIVFQLAGTRSPWSCRRALARNGTLVLAGGTGRLAGVDRIVKALALGPFVPQKLRPFMTQPSRQDLVTLTQFTEAGTVMPVIDRTYELPDVPEAIRYLEQGHARGKIVITV